MKNKNEDRFSRFAKDLEGLMISTGVSPSEFKSLMTLRREGARASSLVESSNIDSLCSLILVSARNHKINKRELKSILGVGMGQILSWSEFRGTLKNKPIPDGFSGSYREKLREVAIALKNRHITGKPLNEIAYDAGFGKEYLTERRMGPDLMYRILLCGGKDSFIKRYE